MTVLYSPVKVSFFETPSVQTLRRQHMVYANSFECLCGSILQNMQADEHYACFKKPTGQIIALDRDGHVFSL